MMQELMASTTEPLDTATRTYYLAMFYEALRALELDESPSIEDWRLCSDALNMVDMIIDLGIASDDGGVLDNAKQAMLGAMERYRTHGVIRRDGAGIQALRAMLEDFADMVNVLPARVMIHTHRKTQARLRDIIDGKYTKKDKVVTL